MVEALIRALDSDSTDEPIYFAYGLGAVIAGLGPVRFRALLPEFQMVRDVVTNRNQGIAVAGPETIWPADHRWVIHTDYDLASTYIACDATTASHLESEPALELQRVALHHRIDDRADEGG